MLLSNATSVEKCEVSESVVITSQEKKDIPQDARDSLSIFARPIHDIDIINVAGNMVNNSKVNVDGKIKNRMLRALVQRAIPDIEQLFKEQSSFFSAFVNIDSLESDRNIAKHRVAKIMIGGKELYITAPEALIAYKLEETIELNSKGNKVEKYHKNIKDLATMISGISRIYDKKELAQGIFDTIQEKESSHFSEHISDLDEIFASITKDIELYIYESGLEDRLSLANITEILENVNISKVKDQLRTDDKQNGLLVSGIEATEKTTRTGTINQQVQVIKIIQPEKSQDKSMTDVSK